MQTAKIEQSKIEQKIDKKAEEKIKNYISAFISKKVIFRGVAFCCVIASLLYYYNYIYR